jgi:acetyl/propionyl-CoA carboxylase alpha subunit
VTVTHRPIRRILVANRGEIAVRVIDAAHELGMATVAVYAAVDRNSMHVHDADVAVSLGDGPAVASYLDQARLLDAALTQGCDAVHPGYGFLSERADFARAVLEAGLTWIGPHPGAIASMGDKLVAKRIAARIGVPTLPSAELSGEAEFEWRVQAGSVGYPLLIKAAAGGGGRGMRLVASEDELAEAVPSARREAEASFGDGTVFAERWLAAPHHVEVQIVADAHGNVIHLGERECSIQRRHQKLIEEAPSPAIDADRRESLGLVAVSVAREIDYDSVGTVEFLLDDQSGDFYFLEMNTRIQVEHRVTEEVAAFDLVRQQIRSAQGDVLQLEQDDIELDGHAIEARLCAEDPAQDWLPTFGTIHRYLDDDVEAGITVDRAVGDGTVIGTEFD